MVSKLSTLAQEITMGNRIQSSEEVQHVHTLLDVCLTDSVLIRFWLLLLAFSCWPHDWIPTNQNQTQGRGDKILGRICFFFDHWDKGQVVFRDVPESHFTSWVSRQQSHDSSQALNHSTCRRLDSQKSSSYLTSHFKEKHTLSLPLPLRPPAVPPETTNLLPLCLLLPSFSKMTSRSSTRSSGAMWKQREIKR